MTQRKKKKLSYNGFFYTIETESKDKIIWKCERCNTTKAHIKCGGRVIIF